MARPKKIVETPGQEKAAPEEKTLVTEGQLSLVRKATDVSTGGTAEQVTNEEGKKQPVRSAPVLTEHGWHVPG